MQNPRFRGNRHSIRNPSSQKGTYSQNMGVLKKLPKLDYRKVVKFIFTILHLVVVVVVVVVVLQFRLVYLNNQRELRNENLHTDRYP